MNTTTFVEMVESHGLKNFPDAQWHSQEFKDFFRDFYEASYRCYQNAYSAGDRLDLEQYAKEIAQGLIRYHIWDKYPYVFDETGE